MSGMLFPKKESSKKRHRHAESIMQKKDGRCWLCMRLHKDFTIYPAVHKHHVYFGQGQRDISEESGFTVFLCWRHHLHDGGPEAVHRDHEICRLIQQETQRTFEQTHTRDEFVGLIGRSYL